MLNEDFEEERRYPDLKNPIATTWLISFDQIRQNDHLAADYLSTMACVAEQNIPASILPESSRHQMINALGTLKAYSFVRQQEGQEMYYVHRLVHLVMRSWLTQEETLSSWIIKTLHRMVKIFPSPMYKNKSAWLALIPHAELIIASVEDTEKNEEVLCTLFHLMGIAFGIQANYSNSGKLFQQAVALKRSSIGEEHASTLSSMYHLAKIYMAQGRFKYAEALHQNVLAVRTSTLGGGHPDTLSSMEELARTYLFLGNLKQSELIQRRSLALKEALYGTDNPLTLNSMFYLALVYSDQGKYDEAAVLHQQTLEIRRKILGEDDPDTINSMHAIAVIYTDQGRYKDAESLYERTLTFAKTVYGPEHPETLDLIFNFAVCYHESGKYIKAESLLLQALASSEKNLEIVDQEAYKILLALATVYRDQGRGNERAAMMVEYHRRKRRWKESLGYLEDEASEDDSEDSPDSSGYDSNNTEDC